jgi:curved DNA-binding protein CbpA
MDYYTLLGVTRNASQDEIKKAYRKLAMVNHPDRGGDNNKFAEINAAYDTLGDPTKRQQYDTPQPQFNHNALNFGGGDLAERGENQKKTREERHAEIIEKSKAYKYHAQEIK